MMDDTPTDTPTGLELVGCFIIVIVVLVIIGIPTITGIQAGLENRATQDYFETEAARAAETAAAQTRTQEFRNTQTAIAQTTTQAFFVTQTAVANEATADANRRATLDNEATNVARNQTAIAQQATDAFEQTIVAQTQVAISTADTIARTEAAATATQAAAFQETATAFSASVMTATSEQSTQIASAQTATEAARLTQQSLASETAAAAQTATEAAQQTDAANILATTQAAPPTPTPRGEACQLLITNQSTLETVDLRTRRDGDCTTQPLALSGTIPGQIEALDISPDGRHAIISARGNSSRDLYLIDFETLEISRLLLTDDNTTDDLDPIWSPDGRSIIVSRGQRSTRDLTLYRVLIDVDNLSTEPLTAIPLFSTDDDTGFRYPVWSPDGSAFAYVQDNTLTDETDRVFIIDNVLDVPSNLSDRSTHQTVTTDSLDNIRGLQWIQPEDATQPQIVIFTPVNAWTVDSTNALILSIPDVPGVSSEAQVWGAPRFSPDGLLIAAIAGQPESLQIFDMNGNLSVTFADIAMQRQDSVYWFDLAFC